MSKRRDVDSPAASHPGSRWSQYAFHQDTRSKWWPGEDEEGNASVSKGGTNLLGLEKRYLDVTDSVIATLCPSLQALAGLEAQDTRQCRERV